MDQQFNSIIVQAEPKAKGKARAKKGKTPKTGEDEEACETEAEEEDGGDGGDGGEDESAGEFADSPDLPEWINSDEEATSPPSEVPSYMELGDENAGKAEPKAKAKAKAKGKGKAKAKPKGKAKAEKPEKGEKPASKKRPAKKLLAEDQENDEMDGTEEELLEEPPAPAPKIPKKKAKAKTKAKEKDQAGCLKPQPSSTQSHHGIFLTGYGRIGSNFEASQDGKR